jgi:hypothetical protein
VILRDRPQVFTIGIPDHRNNQVATEQRSSYAYVNASDNNTFPETETLMFGNS